MKRKIQTVLSRMNQTELADIMGVKQAAISRLLSTHPGAMVHYKDDEITHISWHREVIMERKT